MKLNSISGITYNVKDLAKSIHFYESLGFRMGKQDERHATCYVNWFWVDLVVDAGTSTADAGAALYIKVDSVDECYQEVTTLGVKPLAEPEKKTSGNREFMVHDPDGHQLVFFEKK